MTANVSSIDGRRSIGNVKGLLHSLVPRAKCFCFYDMSRNCSWSGDGADDYELDNFVADLPDEIFDGSETDAACLRRTLPSGRTVLLLSVTAEKGRALGVLIAVFSRNAGKSSWFNPSLLGNILLPVVDVIRDNVLAARCLLRAERRAESAERELTLVYQLDEKVHGRSRSHSGLARLVGQSGRFLEIGYSVLLVPAKRIRISATHSDWKALDRKALDDYLLETLYPKLAGEREPVVYEIPASAPSGSPEPQGYQAMLCPLLDNAGNLEGVLAQLGRVSGERFAAGHLRFMSHIARNARDLLSRSFDSMTGLMNRSGFSSQVAEAIVAVDAARTAPQIIYCDIDNLHLVNDTFGEAAGDEVIKRFGQLLEDSLPKHAVASRVAGDDFAVLLTRGGEQDALELADTLREKSRQLRYLEGDRSLQITLSAGVAGYSTAQGNEAELIRAARIACDAAKDHGRDRVEVYDPGDQSIVRRCDDMHLVAEIQQALDTNGFELLAQPIVSLADKARAPRYEILLRMRDADGSRIAPGAFLSAAERYQLMPQIDRWVVSSALSCLGSHAAFLDDSGVRFSINLSGQSLGDDDIRCFVEDEIDDSGVPATALGFEVTESAAVAHLDGAQTFIDSLRERGCHFSLDNFGAGLSSFAYLKNFRVDTLNIDGSFIRDITENRISESMVAAIAEVARVLELDTVAECVETEATKSLLRKLGVDFAQGHAIGKPQPLAELLAETAAMPAATGG